jgi:hypothetical protein
MLPTLTAACLWMTVPSHAQNRCVYPLGMSAIEERSDVGPSGQAERYAINSLGFAVLGVFPKQTSVGIKYFKEFGNSATFQGYSLQVVASMGF